MNIYFQRGFERSFGTFPLKGAELAAALRNALEVGYRSIDTAQMYENEADVGLALQSTGVPRSELCITTKVHPDNFSSEKFLPSVEESLKKLKVEQVDVLLLHWPALGGDVVPSLRLLEQALKMGFTRYIGVSNYTAAMMRLARQTIATPLVTNQVEFHPLLDQSILLKAAEETGIPLRPTARLLGARCSSSRCSRKLAKATARQLHRWCCAGFSKRVCPSTPCLRSAPTSRPTLR